MIGVTITGVAPANGAGYTQQGGIADQTLNEVFLDCVLTLSGSYGTGASHGDTINFGSVSPPFNFGNGAPTDWSIKELVVAGAAATGFQFNYCPGPTLAAPTQNAGVLQIVGGATASQDGLNEITQGATYASQSPSLDGIKLKARFTFYRL